MTINTPSQALAVANQVHHNVPGACQAYTRGYYNAPSAGDFDGDGAADAEDGWKKEPLVARHSDRVGRKGYPASFLGGSHDNGHRAIFVNPGIVRSTDFNGVTKRYDAGNVGNGTVAQVEAAMNVTYTGWSETIDGFPIPLDKKSEPTKPRRPGKVIGHRVKEMRRLSQHVKAVPGTKRFTWLQKLKLLLNQAPSL